MKMFPTVKLHNFFKIYNFYFVSLFIQGRYKIWNFKRIFYDNMISNQQIVSYQSFITFQDP
jgi:hypothetical protein